MGGDSCNQNLLLICLKRLVSHFETILTLRNTSGGAAAKPHQVCNAVSGFTDHCARLCDSSAFTSLRCQIAANDSSNTDWLRCPDLVRTREIWMHSLFFFMNVANVFSFPWQAFTIIDQNRDGIISKDDLRDVLATMGQLNVKNEELEAMVKEASGPINFTVFLTMFGEKLKGVVTNSLRQTVYNYFFVVVFLCFFGLKGQSHFQALIPRTSSWALSRSWTPRALAASRRNCKSCIYLHLCSLTSDGNTYPRVLLSLEELLTTQCDRFTAEEVGPRCLPFPSSHKLSWGSTLTPLSTFFSVDGQPVGCFPPWCGWQCGLQEHLLRYHTRRGKGGVNAPLLKSSPPVKHPYSLHHLLTPLPFLQRRGSLAHVRAPSPARSVHLAAHHVKTCLISRDARWEDWRRWGCLCVSSSKGTWDYFPK